MRKRDNLFFATLLAIGLTACSTNNGGDSPSSNEKVMHVQQGSIMSTPQSFDNVDPSAITSLHADADTVTIDRRAN